MKRVSATFLVAMMLCASVAATAAPLPGQIMVDPNNPAWFVYNRDSNGDRKLDPYYLCGAGDPEGFLYRGTRNPDGTRDGDQIDIINKIASLGMRGIYLMAVRSNGGDGDSTQNPFVDSDTSGRLDVNILNQWEQWFTAMDNAGILIFFIFFDDQARIWDTGDTVSAPEAAFIEGLVNKFKHHKHLIWVWAEEYSYEFSERHVENAAAIIQATDEYQHPIAVHHFTGVTEFGFKGMPYINEFAFQPHINSTDELHDSVASVVHDAGRHYNVNMAEAFEFHNHLVADGNSDELRRSNWGVALAGAYVMDYGTWGNPAGRIANTGVGGGPTDQMLRDCGTLQDFMESAPINTMTTHDELKNGDTMWVLANPGTDYIGYSYDDPQTMGFSKMTPGQYHLVWLDTKTGQKVTQNNLTVSGSSATWDLPSQMTSGEIALYAGSGATANTR